MKERHESIIQLSFRYPVQAFIVAENWNAIFIFQNGVFIIPQPRVGFREELLHFVYLLKLLGQRRIFVILLVELIELNPKGFLIFNCLQEAHALLYLPILLPFQCELLLELFYKEIQADNEVFPLESKLIEACLEHFLCAIDVDSFGIAEPECLVVLKGSYELEGCPRRKN